MAKGSISIFDRVLHTPLSKNALHEKWSFPKKDFFSKRDQCTFCESLRQRSILLLLVRRWGDIWGGQNVFVRNWYFWKKWPWIRSRGVFRILSNNYSGNICKFVKIVNGFQLLTDLSKTSITVFVRVCLLISSKSSFR